MPPGKKRPPPTGAQTTGAAPVSDAAPRSAPVSSWRLWSHGETLTALNGITPLLDSWNSKIDPAQIRLQTYLDDLQNAVGPLPSSDESLFLHMTIDVVKPERLLRHHDVENYLFPVVYRLGASRFVFVSATKRVGGGSRLVIGRAEPRGMHSMSDGWEHLSCGAGRGPARKEWKAGIRDALLASRPRQLPPGPVAVQLAWRCSRQRNWAMLWKATGDSMGPVLGEPYPGNPFNPDDGRIVSLELHLNADDAISHDVDVGMWWRTATTR